MKNINMVLIAISFVLLFSSCEEEVFPKGELYDTYIFSCVLDGNSDYQTAFISRSYDVAGFDPYSNPIDPSIANARIRLIYDGALYEFKDSTIVNGSDDRYTGEKHFYYLDNFRPSANKEVNIEVELPDGTILTSSSTTFPVKLTAGSFYRSDHQIPSENPTQSFLFFKWGDFSSNVYYVPKFTISYSQIVGDELIPKEVIVPQFIENDNPVYPGLMIGDNLMFSMNSVEYALESIRETGIPDSNFVIHGAYYSVLLTDNELATFYAAAKTFSDSYSVALIEPEYSNINGGLGILGSFIKYGFELEFEREFVEGFGYLYTYEH